jgi:sugar phosphate permease
MNAENVIVEVDASQKPRGKGNVRWWIVWTLFFSTVTNYISRQTFSVLAPLITAQYHLTHTDLSKILGAFQISYALTWLLGGIFLDAVGTRLGLALAVVFWSVINILTGFASSRNAALPWPSLIAAPVSGEPWLRWRFLSSHWPLVGAPHSLSPALWALSGWRSGCASTIR